MGYYLSDKRDTIETDLEDIIDKIDYFYNSCLKWRNDLCDTYNDNSWFNSVTQWMSKEVRVIIEWLDHIIEWADYFSSTLQKIHDGIVRVYDDYTESELNSTPKINIYLDKSYKRCKIAYEWYDIAVEIYENFGHILSGKYDWDVVSRLIKRDNELFNMLSSKADEYEDNSDHFWQE